MATGNNGTTRLFVGSNLPESVNEKSLSDHFRDVREDVEGVEIIRDSRGNSKGFGFVTFTTAAAARRAIDRYNRSQIGGFQVRVDFDKSSNPRREKRSGPSYPDRRPASSHQSSRWREHRSSMSEQQTYDDSDKQTKSQKLPPSRRKERGRPSYQAASTKELSSQSSNSAVRTPPPEVPAFSVPAGQSFPNSSYSPPVINQDAAGSTLPTSRPPGVVWENVSKLLETCGSLQEREFPQGCSSGLDVTCVARFTSSLEAKEAVSRLNGMLLHGCTMTVKPVGTHSVEVGILVPPAEVNVMPSPEDEDELQLPQASSP